MGFSAVILTLAVLNQDTFAQPLFACLLRRMKDPMHF